MLVEANPRQFSDYDSPANASLEELAEHPAQLFNRAWKLFLDAPAEYEEWEDQAIQSFLRSDLNEQREIE